MNAIRGPRNGILSLAIKDKAVLYAAYMPFVKNGGLFIPTKKDYQLGDEVFMLLNLMEEAEKIPVAGTVVWITPKGAQGARVAGIGKGLSTKVNASIGTSSDIIDYEAEVRKALIQSLS